MSNIAISVLAISHILYRVTQELLNPEAKYVLRRY